MRPMNVSAELTIAETALSLETPHHSLASMPGWLEGEFHRFHRIDRLADAFKRFHVLTLASIAIAAAQGMFAIARAPVGATYFFTFAVLLGCLALLCLPVSFVGTRVTERRRLALVRKFYGINLRLDADGRLFVNRANGALILDLPTR